MSDNKAALAAAMAGGYLLGRTRKAKLAFAVGSYLAGRRLGLSPGQVLSQGLGGLQLAPQFQQLSEQVRGELLTAGRTAVTAAANRRLTGLADTLRDRTDALTGVGRRDDGGQERDDGYAGNDGYDDAVDEADYFDDEEREEDREPAPAPPRKAAPRPAASGGRAPAKKAATKKTATKKATAKKAVPPGSRRGGGRK